MSFAYINMLSVLRMEGMYTKIKLSVKYVIVGVVSRMVCDLDVTEYACSL